MPRTPSSPRLQPFFARSKNGITSLSNITIASVAFAQLYLGPSRYGIAETPIASFHEHLALWWFAGVEWCGRRDSNSHECYLTATSTLRVYQFRHDRIADDFGRRSINRANHRCEGGFAERLHSAESAMTCRQTRQMTHDLSSN